MGEQMEGRFLTKPVKEMVKFKLEEQDFAGLAKKIAELSEEMNGLELEFQKAKEKHKALYSTRELERDRLFRVISSGEEEREVDCVERMDFERGVVELFHGAERIKTRAMQDWERQESMV